MQTSIAAELCELGKIYLTGADSCLISNFIMKSNETAEPDMLCRCIGWRRGEVVDGARVKRALIFAHYAAPLECDKATAKSVTRSKAVEFWKANWQESKEYHQEGKKKKNCRAGSRTRYDSASSKAA